MLDTPKCIHRCRSRHILGGAKSFCPNISKLARKKSKDNAVVVTGCKAVQAPFLAKLHPSLPKFVLTCPKPAKLKYDLKRLHFHFGCHFCKINAHTAILRRFTHILPKCLHILRGFCPDFHQVKNFGGALAPTPPAPLNASVALRSNWPVI